MNAGLFHDCFCIAHIYVALLCSFLLDYHQLEVYYELGSRKRCSLLVRLMVHIHVSKRPEIGCCSLRPVELCIMLL